MRSKTSALAFVAMNLIFAAGTAGCASTAPSTGSISTTRTTSAEVARLSDAQIAAAVSLANVGDLQRARYGQTQAMAPDVRSLADDIARDDANSSLQLGALLQQKSIEPAVNPLTYRVSSENDAQSEALRSTSGPAFDRTFLIAEARSGQRFLDLIDASLTPSAEDRDLRRMLSDLRARALSHRNEATRLLSAVATE